jgi:hypothetical protein
VKSIEKGCEYTKTIFERAYFRSPSTIEFLLKSFKDTAKKSVEYGPETMKPFIDSFVHFMEFDVNKETTYLSRIFQSMKPVIVKSIQSDQFDTVGSYLVRLSNLRVCIKYNQNFDAVEIYVLALREILQELLRYGMKRQEESVEEILFMMRRIFSDFSKFSESEIQEKDRRRQKALERIINESRSIGYTLIHRKKIDLFDEYLSMVEDMYLRVSDLEWNYYPTMKPDEIELYEESEEIRENLEGEFFLLLFRLGVFCLGENNHEFIARLLSRGEVGRSFSVVNFRLHEDFLEDFQPENYIGWALRDSIKVLGEIGEFAPVREAVQFYFLIRSKALFKGMKKSIPDTWDYSGLRLIELLDEYSEWIFFGKEKPEDFQMEGRNVSFVSDFIEKIEKFNTREIEAKGCSDFPDYMRAIKIFGDRKTLFQDVAGSFTNDEIISQEAFGGALEEFEEITIRVLEKASEIWEKERKRIERSFPIVEKRKVEAEVSIKKALEGKGVFRNAVTWVKSNEKVLQETKFMLSEVLLKKKIGSKPLKDLPIIAFFDRFGERAARREDEEILNIISERNIKKARMPLTINVGTISQFLEELDCRALVLITGRNIKKDFWDAKEIKYLRSFDNSYEVSIDEERKALLYPSSALKERTLIFAKDEFLEVVCSEEEKVDIRSPRENELSNGEIKEDFQTIVISQRRGLKFLDLSKGILIE